MSLTTIIILIALGIVLLIIELLVIPGISVAAIASTVLILIGIGAAYKSHDLLTANIVLASTLVLIIATMMIAFRANTWSRLALKDNIDGRVNVAVENDEIKVGDTGITISRLAPMGQVKVNNKLLEGKSESGFIDDNTEIQVIKIQNTAIIVKPINQHNHGV